MTEDAGSGRAARPGGTTAVSLDPPRWCCRFGDEARDGADLALVVVLPGDLEPPPHDPVPKLARRLAFSALHRRAPYDHPPARAHLRHRRRAVTRRRRPQSRRSAFPMPSPRREPGPSLPSRPHAAGDEIAGTRRGAPRRTERSRVVRARPPARASRPTHVTALQGVRFPPTSRCSGLATRARAPRGRREREMAASPARSVPPSGCESGPTSRGQGLPRGCHVGARARLAWPGCSGEDRRAAPPNRPPRPSLAVVWPAFERSCRAGVLPQAPASNGHSEVVRESTGECPGVLRALWVSRAAPPGRRGRKRTVPARRPTRRRRVRDLATSLERCPRQHARPDRAESVEGSTEAKRERHLGAAGTRLLRSVPLCARIP